METDETQPGDDASLPVRRCPTCLRALEPGDSADRCEYCLLFDEAHPA